MNVSIVLTTYNGQRYISSQLDSLINQTRQADEVLIFDDCSEDNTTLIIDEFIKKKQSSKLDTY